MIVQKKGGIFLPNITNMQNPNIRKKLISEVAYKDMLEIIENEEKSDWVFQGLELITWRNLRNKKAPKQDFYMLTFVQSE